MSNKELFKLAFYLKCAERGLKPYQVDSLLVKQAVGVGDILGGLGGIGGIVGAAAIAAPPAIGYGLGALSAKGTSTDINEDDIKKQELIEEYKRLARRARLQSRLRQAKQGDLP